MTFRLTPLSEALIEFNARLGDAAEPTVLTLTEGRGFVEQSIRFKKRLAIADTSKYKLIERGDIAFNPYLLWAGAVAHNDKWDAGLLSPLYPTFRPRPEVDSRYVWHMLRSPTALSRFDAISFGSVPRKRRAATPDFLRVEIPLPHLPEQRRIAAVLDQADELRAKRRRSLAHLDQLEDAVFFSTFGDVTRNSLGFAVAPFSDLGQLDRGVSRARPRNSAHLLGGNHPLVQTGEVAGSGGYIRTFTQSYSDEGLAQSKMWPAGTLAITIAANIAKTGVLTFPACFPDSVVGFTPEPSRTNVEYVRFWLRSLQATLERQAPASAQKNINLAILRALRVPVPPIDVQDQFASDIASIELLRADHSSHLAKLDELFASLQHRAFTGQL